MNKFLLPLALLFCAGAASAQNAATVFGTIYLGAVRISSSSGTINGSGAQKALSVQGLTVPATAAGSNSSGYEVSVRHFF